MPTTTWLLSLDDVPAQRYAYGGTHHIADGIRRGRMPVVAIHLEELDGTRQEESKPCDAKRNRDASA